MGEADLDGGIEEVTISNDPVLALRELEIARFYRSPSSIALALAAAVALIRFKANLLLVLAACAIAGLAAHAAGL